VRGLLAEHGIVAPRGIARARRLLVETLSEPERHGLSEVFRETLLEIAERPHSLDCGQSLTALVVLTRHQPQSALKRQSQHAARNQQALRSLLAHHHDPRRARRFALRRAPG